MQTVLFPQMYTEHAGGGCIQGEAKGVYGFRGKVRKNTQYHYFAGGEKKKPLDLHQQGKKKGETLEQQSKPSQQGVTSGRKKPKERGCMLKAHDCR